MKTSMNFTIKKILLSTGVPVISIITGFSIKDYLDGINNEVIAQQNLIKSQQEEILKNQELLLKQAEQNTYYCYIGMTCIALIGVFCVFNHYGADTSHLDNLFDINYGLTGDCAKELNNQMVRLSDQIMQQTSKGDRRILEVLSQSFGNLRQEFLRPILSEIRKLIR